MPTSPQTAWTSALLSVFFIALFASSTLTAQEQPIPVGSDFQINTHTTGYQDYPAVAMNPAGDFVVVWQHRDGSDTRLRAQLFHSNGSTLGAELSLTTVTAPARSLRPDVARSGADFVVSWGHYDGISDIDIRARRFNSIGAPVSSEIQVNSFTTNFQVESQIAMAPSGAFVVVWEDFRTGNYDIHGRAFTSDGSPSGSEFIVNSYTTGLQDAPSVAFVGQSGNFVVVWDSYYSANGDPNFGSIQGRLFNSIGVSLGPDFLVNSYTTGDQSDPALASLDNGEFIVTWGSQGSPGGHSGNNSSIQGRRFAADTLPLSSQFQVGSVTTGEQSLPTVAASADGGFTILWAAPFSQVDLFPSIRGRAFDSSGAPRGDQFQVNTYTTNTQNRPSVALDAGGNFAAVWESDGSAGTDNNFGSIQGRRYIASGEVGNYIWFDDNVDGVQDVAESGLPGVAIDLIDEEGAVYASTTSGADGSYLFSKVPPGDYSLRVTAPSGFLFTRQDLTDDDMDSDVNESGESHVFTVVPGISNLDVDAGLRSPKIGDRVWVDSDGNGLQTGDEPGLEGVTITLIDDEGTQIAQTTSVEQGEYYLYAPNGEYYLDFTPPPNYVWTTQDAGSDDDIDSDVSAGGATTLFNIQGVDDLSWDAGLISTLVDLGDRVWIDTDLDGVQDGGELGADGVGVELFTAAGVSQGTTTTAADGSYSFNDVSPGVYYLKFTAPSGFCFTAQDQGTDDALDSDVDPASGTTLLFTLDPSTDDMDRDAGLAVEASIGNRVWLDDGNGIQDGGESGVQDVTVRLYDATGGFLDEEMTDPEGNYNFAPGPGSYYLQFILPSDFAFAPRDQGLDDNVDSDPNPGSGTTIVFTLAPGTVDASRDAGIEPATIGNRVWLDDDGDGRQSPSEVGLAGVTVHLLNAAGTQVASTLTDAGGEYGFLGVASGQYRIEVVPPPGGVFSPQNVGTDPLIDSDVNPADGRSALFTYQAASASRSYDAGLRIISSVLLNDGFESGDTSSWSSSVP